MAAPSGNELTNRLTGAPRASVDGTWFRHVPIRYREAALTGHVANGRWSRSDGFPVVYLGEPEDSVVAEAYRHLVDPVEGAIAEHIAPRVLVTCHVAVTNLLDLTTAGTRLLAGLDLATLRSPTNDVDAYEACRTVAATAHQLGFHGVLAPAATQVGRTLALFPNTLPADELPRRTGEVEWHGLPVAPGKGRAILRVVKD